VSSDARLWYSLYAVIEHSGTLRSGHYMAYVKLSSSQTRCLDFLQSLSPSDISVNQLVNKLRHCSSQRDQQQRQDIDDSASASWSAADGRTVEQPCDGGGTGDSQWSAGDGRPCAEGRWYHVSDASVTQVNLDSVLRCQAYILFYERIG